LGSIGLSPKFAMPKCGYGKKIFAKIYANFLLKCDKPKNFLALNQTSAKVFGFAFIFWLDKFWSPTKQARYFYMQSEFQSLLRGVQCLFIKPLTLYISL
jgi:hypothetical protein